MKKTHNWIINYWWIILMCTLAFYIIFVSIINCPELNRITSDIFKYFKQIIGSLVAILGLILGYPILKKKLLNNYITEEFELIHKNNRILRKECLRLSEKYPQEYISTKLNHKYLEELLLDCKELNQLAIDANPESYKYSYLLYKSILYFYDNTKSTIPNDTKESYYCENLSCLANSHINQIYKYSKSIGFVPKSGSIKEQDILVTKLRKYVSNNKYYQVVDIDYSLTNKHTSALLVVFFSITNASLSQDNGLLCESFYRAAPSPSPLARILYNQEIYMPLRLEGNKLLGDKKELVLVGYKKMRSLSLDGRIIKDYIVFHYANIGMGGFIKGTMMSKESLKEFKDVYINKTVLNTDDIKEYCVTNERIIISVDTDKATQYFEQIKPLLSKKMTDELNV